MIEHNFYYSNLVARCDCCGNALKNKRGDWQWGYGLSAKEIKPEMKKKLKQKGWVYKGLFRRKLYCPKCKGKK